MRGGGWPLARFWLTVFLLLLSGCSETDPNVLPPSPLSFEELKQRVSRIRGLPFEHEISLETGSTETIQAVLEKSLGEEYRKENLQQQERVYARLGLLPEAADLAKALLELRLFHQGVYDSRGKTILLPKEPLKTGLMFLGASSVPEDITKQFLLIHALSYILQEQHFRWEEKIRNRNTEDSGLALRALKKGDAVLVGLEHLMGDPKENRQKIINGVKTLSRLPAQIDRELPHLPELLRQKEGFQFVQGSEFVSWAYFLKGWAGVNALFRHPPLSTEQILHPEKYYLKRDDPVRITPWALIQRLSGKKIMEETLGEFLILTLLSRSLSKGEAMQAAAGWAGDSLLAFQQGEELVLGWVTAWDDREEAGEFYRGFRRALERRHGVPLGPSQTGADTLTTSPSSRSSLLLQIRDNFVFFLDGIPAPRSVEIADSLWDDLETGVESEPFELAKRSRQTRPAGK